MAKVKVRREGNVLWEDECQPLTNEQVESIKSQFHPSSTANVNITPYHIYDEDGVEQVVGEVRKTIDGVKKCKPVYEKTVEVTPTTSGVSIATDVDNFIYAPMIKRSYSSSSTDIVTDCGTELANAICFIFANNTLKAEAVSSQYTAGIATITIQYTKTTDIWQPV